MGRREKLLQRWINNPNCGPPWDQVESLLEYYDFEIDQSGGGSHRQVSHELLRNVDEYGLLGEFTIAVKGGQTVKGWVIKKVIEAVDKVCEIKDQPTDF